MQDNSKNGDQKLGSSIAGSWLLGVTSPYPLADHIRQQSLAAERYEKLCFKYGDGFAEKCAVENGVTLYAAAERFHLEETIGELATTFRDAFGVASRDLATALRDLSAQMAQDTAKRVTDALDDASGPHNRHTRRAHKHAKPLDNPQSWSNKSPQYRYRRKRDRTY